jgi:hypothetical protein
MTHHPKKALLRAAIPDPARIGDHFQRTYAENIASADGTTWTRVVTRVDTHGRAIQGLRRSAGCNSYRRGEPISGRMITFASAPLNSVISPTFLPGAGSNRAARGLFHLNASVGTVAHDSRDGFLTRVARKWPRWRILHRGAAEDQPRSR